MDKVKQLFLIPEMEVMTTKMVAEYFEVDVKTIQSVYQRNKSEVDSDGVVVEVGNRIRQKLDTFKVQVSNHRGYFSVNGLNLSNANNTLFPRRAILRIAMLLRDSEVAREVRTQLLNVVEHVTKNDLRVRSNGLRRR